jgi:hypothetical protein
MIMIIDTLNELKRTLMHTSALSTSNQNTKIRKLHTWWTHINKKLTIDISIIEDLEPF